MRVWGRAALRGAHHAAEVLADEVGVLLDGLAHGAKDDAGLGEVSAKGGGDGDRVEDGVHRDVGEALLLVERDAELVEGAQELGVHLVEALLLLLLLGLAVVRERLVVDGRVRVVRPRGLFHAEPAPEGAQAELEHPLGLVLLGADGAHDVLVQARGERVGLNHRLEAVLVGAVEHLLEVALLRLDHVLLRDLCCNACAHAARRRTITVRTGWHARHALAAEHLWRLHRALPGPRLAHGPFARGPNRQSTALHFVA